LIIFMMLGRLSYAATRGVEMINKLLEYIPHGNTLDEGAWRRRHGLVSWVLLLHVPGLFLFGLSLGQSMTYTLWAAGVPLACLGASRLVRNRRVASFFVTVGLVFCSAALVGLSRGSIEAHFHFFIIIGFIALYQDWVPFLWNIAFTVLSHGIGSVWETNLIFNHPAGQQSPWTWSAVHGLAVLFACGGVVVFWKSSEQEQQKNLKLATELADAEVSHRRFTSDLLVNLARRNQSLLYRQLRVINQLEEQEKDPDALADLFHLDHLATRIRRNAESLLVLSGEQPTRTWTKPVPLLDVVRAAIAETDDLERVVFNVDQHVAASGQAVSDLTHLLAELIENAVRFSPPDTNVSIRTRPHLQPGGGWVLTVEDWGVGLPADDLASANEMLADPKEVDLSVSQRLGLHVVARLAQRHGVEVALSPTPGGGITAVVVLPDELFSGTVAEPVAAAARPAAAPAPSLVSAGASVAPVAVARNGLANEPVWQGWWEHSAAATDLSAPGRPQAGSRATPTLDRAEFGRTDFGRTDFGRTDFGRTDFGGTDFGGASFGMADLGAAGFRTADLPAPQPPVADAPAPPPRPLRPAAPAPDQRPIPPPAELESGLAEDAQDPAGTARLTRRVPQAHLAPELRQNGAPAAAEVTPPAERLPNAAQAKAALARYQASRRAARAVVEDRTAEGGGERS
jgi:signal transduction histidine kinase